MNEPENAAKRGTDAKARCVAQYREQLGMLLGCALKILPAVKFDKHNPQHLAAICLYATIFQSVSDCYRLMEESATVGVPGMMRSMLESYADLCAVIQNANYPKKMLATFRDEQRKHLEDMLRFPSNPFHADVATTLIPPRNSGKFRRSWTDFARRSSFRSASSSASNWPV
jgi:hypothetical protein